MNNKVEVSAFDDPEMKNSDVYSEYSDVVMAEQAEPVDYYNEHYQEKYAEFDSKIIKETEQVERQRISDNPIRFTKDDCVEPEHAEAFICTVTDCNKLAQDPQVRPCCKVIICKDCV